MPTPRRVPSTAAVLFALALAALLPGCRQAPPPTAPAAAPPACPAHDCPAGAWRFFPVADGQQVLRRHEGAFIALGDELFLLGGRRVQPVQAFNPQTGRLRRLAPPPIELHHFQALAWRGKIVVVGAMTGPFPGETPVPHVYFFDPAANTWTVGPEIPEDRRRGGAGAVLHGGWIYVVSGIIDGHRSGWVPWLDRFRPDTGAWQRLPDAPRARDHFQAAVTGDRLVAAGGRRSGERGVFASLVAPVDVYDLNTSTWVTLPPALNIPTPRAGCMAMTVGGKVVVAGGETDAPAARDEVEALDLDHGAWSAWPSLPEGRHASQLTRLHDALWIGSGANARGGEETDTLLRLPLGPCAPYRSSDPPPAGD